MSEPTGPIGPGADLGGRSDAPFGVSSDANDVLIRRARATPDDARVEVCVRIDGHDVVLPKAVRRTDPKGGELRGRDGEPLFRRTTVYDAARWLAGLGRGAAPAPAPVWDERELKRRIPTLCHMTHLNPAAVCRTCSVHVATRKRGGLSDERKLLPACHLEIAGYDASAVAPGEPWIVVTTHCGGGPGPKGHNPETWPTSDEEQAAQRRRAELVRRSVSVVVEMLAADHLTPARAADRRYENELGAVAALFGVSAARPSLRRPEGMRSRNLQASGRADLAQRPETDPLRPSGRPPRPIPLETLRPTIAPEDPELAQPDGGNYAGWNEGVDRDYPYSSHAVVVDHDACIQCDRCVRSCGDVRGYHIIGHTRKGYAARIAFDLDNLMGPRSAGQGPPSDDARASNCVQCGECMTACPTGALTARRRVRPHVWESGGIVPRNPVEPLPAPDDTDAFLPAAELRELEVRYRDLQDQPDAPLRTLRPFGPVPLAYLAWNEGAVRRITIPAGGRRLLVRSGEYGSTAFLLGGTGTFEIFDEPPTETGLVGRLLGRPAYVSHGAPRARVPGTGLLLGEMAPLSYGRRTATVWAAAVNAQTGAPEETVVYELTRNLLDTMLRGSTERDAIRRVYAGNAVREGLRRSDALADLPPGEREELVKRVAVEPGVRLRRLERHDEIVRQGDPGGNFYIVHTGNVKIEVCAGGSRRTVAHLGAHQSVGEIALLAGERSVQAEFRHERQPDLRTATATALDSVELVEIPAAVFRDVLCRESRVKDRLVALAVSRLRQDDPTSPAPRPVPLAVLPQFIEQGLYQAQNLLVIDLNSCTRCDECTRACTDAHPEWRTPLLRRPKDGHARMLRDGLRYGDFLVVTSCRSCHTPYCLNDCPVDAIHRRGDRLEVVIDGHCIGCGLCEKNCPYGSIEMVPRTGPPAPLPPGAAGTPALIAGPRRAVNCDLCGGKEPACVHACPHESAHRLSGDALREFFARDPSRRG
jgi:Fe-S-cluster-containing hydrogenase component 2/CRP-like cAMP-binding protein